MNDKNYRRTWSALAQRFLLVLIFWGIGISPALAVLPDCTAKDGIKRYFGTSPTSVPNDGHLQTLATQFRNGGVPELAQQFREPVAALLDRFDAYFGGRAPVTDVFDQYQRTVGAILDYPLGTASLQGHDAILAVNRLTRLFDLFDEATLSLHIRNQSWLRTSYTQTQALTSNALRTTLHETYLRNALKAEKIVAFAGAVRWNSPTDVRFSGLYINQLDVAGSGFLTKLEAAGFWRYVPGSANTSYEILNVDAYVDFIKENFYTPGYAMPLNVPNTETALADVINTDYPLKFTPTHLPQNGGIGLSQDIEARMRAIIPNSVYKNQTDGLPGVHAEVQAANELLWNALLLPLQRLGVHTLRSKVDFCTGFECCAGCTDILRGFATSTAGGGDRNDPMRRD